MNVGKLTTTVSIDTSQMEAAMERLRAALEELKAAATAVGEASISMTVGNIEPAAAEGD
jgi:hypothetical protein